MADTFSAALGLLLMGTGGDSNSWGTNQNVSVFQILEDAVAGKLTISTTGGTRDLSATPPPAGPSAARYAILDCTAALISDLTIQIPNLTKWWIVRNATSGAFAVSIKTPSGAAVAIPQGMWTLVWCDGSNVVNPLVGSLAVFNFLVAASATAARAAIGINDVGMIVCFTCPAVPTGYLECNGSAKSRATFVDLYNAITIRQTGTRSSTGNGIITGLSDTSNMRQGYPVSGTGIPSSTTIASVDSATQITLSQNNASLGSSEVVVAPWGVGDGSTTFNIPLVTDTGRFLRSRTSSIAIGSYQANQNLAHTHAGTTDSGGAHTHTGTTDNPSTNPAVTDHADSSGNKAAASGFQASSASGGPFCTNGTITLLLPNHVHTFTTASGGAHTHTFTTASAGGTEARPEAAAVLVCVKY